MNGHYFDDRTLTVEALTPELRERGRIPRGTPAKFAVVQRDGRGVLLSVLKSAIEESEAVSLARYYMARAEKERGA